ncbi:beta-lactamase domain-containing protein [Alcanivorax sp. S71-1-4]|uniref:MBL fold metallo-hydrolase n=1 Tax=Alcanivorax sp. S71-1-4 TaxID=1177159 RepID=UPI00135C7554|nr:MBL fold metallo-hydrolase [Alcanivorax sp. S71-1-4]KAF0810363.1 beta-lactamase domain-containing protein [Alcanivorax sp. S71-1-4]
MLEQLASDLWRLRLPVRFAPGHINSYLLRDGEGWLAVDCGKHDEATRQVWQGFLDSPQYGAGIQRIFLTHTHPDHSGSADWLAAQTGARVLLAEAEHRLMEGFWRGSATQPQALMAFFAEWGATEAQQQAVLAFMSGFRAGNPSLSGPLEYVAPGECLTVNGRPWHLAAGFGHTACNLLLHDRAGQRLITGDQVLPGIYPNVSVWHGLDGDPLGGYLGSLTSLAALDVAQAFPAHGDVFTDFAARCVQIQRHHAWRLQRLRRYLDGVGEAPVEALNEAVFGRAAEGPMFMLMAGQLYALLARLRAQGLAEQVTRESWRAVSTGEIS